MKRLVLPVLLTGLFCSAMGLRADVLGDRPAPAGPARFPSAGLGVEPGLMSAQAQNEVIFQYCYRCHNDELRRGDLSLESFDAARLTENAAIAEKMIRKLRAGMMPPKASRQPDMATRMALVTAFETTLDAAAAANPNPGHRSFQRLNRAEYAAAVRALVGLDIDVTGFLPADTISASFDNIADVQMPSATVMQGYLRAAAHVSRVAVGDRAADPGSTTYDVPRTQSQKERVEGAPFGTRGGTVVVHNFPADGQYRFQLLLHGEPTGALFGRTIGDIQMEVAIDGERVALVTVDRWMSESDPDGLGVTIGPVYVRSRGATRGSHVHPGVRGLGGRPHQADRPHPGRHADRRRLRRHHPAAPAQPRHRRAVRSHGRVRQSRRAGRSSPAGRRRPRKRCRARGASSSGCRRRPTAGPFRPATWTS